MIRRTFAALLSIAMGFLCSRAVASGVPWIERAAGAPLQLVGRCESVSSRWEGGAIYSTCELSVLRVARGTAAGTLLVRQRGGTVDGIAQKVSHVTSLAPGRTYLLFLTSDGSGNWSPTAKGVNPVEESDDVGERVGGEPLEEVLRTLGGGD